jgi:hypothetical protein
VKLTGALGVRESASQLGEVHVIFLLSFLVGTVLAMVGYAQARSFVTRRLRYVDAVHTAFAPIIAGVGAALLALPIVAFLPFVGAGTALSFGIAVGAGVAAGSRDVRRRLPSL